MCIVVYNAYCLKGLFCFKPVSPFKKSKKVSDDFIFHVEFSWKNNQI